MLIKVCGMKYEENIREVSLLSPNFMGFIFYEESPRNLCTVIHLKLSEKINRVGVFVDKDQDFIVTKATDFQLNYIQLHGNESPRLCRDLQTLGYKVIKAFNIHEEFIFQDLKEYEPYCKYFLFDAFGKKAGGNGITFNWSLLENYQGNIPFLLSGGINETMAKEIKKVEHPKCKGIDINSGFEIKPGLKNLKKIEKFITELQS